MRKLCAFAVLIGVMWSTNPVQAWNSTGHMIVAYIAYQNLTPRTRARVSALLRRNPTYKKWIQGVSANQRDLVAFLNAATWPDCIKRSTACPGYSPDGSNNGETPPNGPAASQNIGYADKTMHKYWHYVDKPYSAGAPGEDPQVPNAETEILLLTKAIGDATINNNIKSYDVVWLEHLVGDVHQPLHCTSRFTKNHPHGDIGGNDVAFCQPPCHDELHAYWDDLLGSKTDTKTITAEAKRLLASGKPVGADEADVSAWTNASFELAKTSVYVAPISEDNDPAQAISPRPDAAYQSAAVQVAQAQVMLAGYRLAALLNNNLK
jgi:hypothetical protein